MSVIHFVEAALTPTHPLSWVRVRAVVDAIVMPCSNMKDCAGRQHGRLIVGVNVIHMPVEVKISHMVQHLYLSIGKNRFH